MNALITYIIASVVSLGIFYAAYVVLLRKEPLFRFNRIYLLSALLLSYLIPLITLLPDSFSLISIKSTGTGFINAITLSPVVITATSGKMSSVPLILGYIYLAGMAYFAARLIIRVFSIYNLGKKSNWDKIEENLILWSDANIPPFSFFRTMYLPSSLKDTPHVNEVIRHEQVHINSLHSFDIVFTQIMQIICWVNPFIPLIEKSLREIHEFEADKAVIQTGTDPVTYTKILFANDKTALAVLLGNNFNYSLIKRRLTMFYKTHTRYAKLKATVVLPLVTSIAMIFAISCRQASEPILPPPPPPPPPPPTEVTVADAVYTVVETMPQFPGGEEARVKYMINTVKYPEAAKKQKLQGIVYVTFVVEKDGSIGDAKIQKGIGKLCDEEAMRVIEAMPKWMPGKQNGKTVRVQFTMPIQFKLN